MAFQKKITPVELYSRNEWSKKEAKREQDEAKRQPQNDKPPKRK